MNRLRKLSKSGLFWLLVLWLIVPPSLVVLSAKNAATGKGFAFTPKWSTAFAIWLLVGITLLLHILVKSQFDESTQEDLKHTDKAVSKSRAVAVDREMTIREEVGGSDAVKSNAVKSDPEAEKARREAVNAAEARTSVAVRARRAGLKSLIIGSDGRASTSKAGR